MDLLESLELLSVGEGDYRTAGEAAAEIERLRAALRHVADSPYPIAEYAERALTAAQ